MTTVEEFKSAASKVQALPKRPDNDALLELYGWYKQATEGDVAGKRPGMLDMKGRAKFDAWTSRKGSSAEAAREAYVKVVDRLARR